MEAEWQEERACLLQMKGKIPAVCGFSKGSRQRRFPNIVYLISYDSESGKDNEKAY